MVVGDYSGLGGRRRPQKPTKTIKKIKKHRKIKQNDPENHQTIQKAQENNAKWPRFYFFAIWIFSQIWFFEVFGGSCGPGVVLDRSDIFKKPLGT